MGFNKHTPTWRCKTQQVPRLLHLHMGAESKGPGAGGFSIQDSDETLSAIEFGNALRVGKLGESWDDPVVPGGCHGPAKVWSRVRWLYHVIPRVHGQQKNFGARSYWVEWKKFLETLLRAWFPSGDGFSTCFGSWSWGVLSLFCFSF